MWLVPERGDIKWGRLPSLLAAWAVLLAGCSSLPPSSSSSAGLSAVSQSAAIAPSGSPASASPTPSASPAPLSLASCPVTLGNGLTPPGEAPSAQNFGNGKLWTVLWPKGIVFVPPDDIGSNGSLSMKFPWWRGPGVRGSLHISGHEIHLSVQVAADIPGGYGQTGFQATGITFPLEGCYTVTGEAGGSELTFITLVRTCAGLAELAPEERQQYSICQAP